MATSNQHPKTLFVILSCLLIFIMPLVAFGITLDEAKQQGRLGERPDGYLGLPQPSSSPDTVNLMKDINNKRREVYRGIAEKNGTALSAVEALAGKKAIEKTPSGQLIMQPNGTWTPKP
ncbi:MAG: YdbL family protein [Nitrospirota bacterium]|nr:YdbL family protein [Nitrospirota bacterium]